MARSAYAAEIGERYTVTETYTTTENGQTVEHTRTRTETEWRSLSGEHVAMYVGNGLVIHAPTTGQRIQYGKWNMMPITAVRRVLPES